jgi:transcriptional regulator NrdR family protein
MAKFVVKKSGEKIPYDIEKIKGAVMAASRDAGLPKEKAGEIAEKVLELVDMAIGAREEVPTSEIKERILAELDSMAPDISKAWRAYDEKNKK